ncbi:MAG TPA: hypothetical protein VFF73_33555 [Planctomycetota bacterium]|nr:hypothetical protein [Planctomycetota bacterium]
MRLRSCMVFCLLAACAGQDADHVITGLDPAPAPQTVWVRNERLPSRPGGLFDRPEEHGARLVTFRDDIVWWARAPLEPAATLRARGERLLEEGALEDALLVLEDARDADDDDAARGRVSLATRLLDQARRERRVPKPIAFETVHPLVIEAVADMGAVTFVHFTAKEGKGCLAGMDATGAYRWRVPIEKSEHAGLLVGRRAYVAFGESVLALDVVEGKVLWAHACSGGAHLGLSQKLAIKDGVLELTATRFTEDYVERLEARTGMLLE